MASQPVRSSYHHGDARNALLCAAAELLENCGVSGLSLRQLAERAGLSRQAPYNHFEDKEALLAELVRDGFERLERIMPTPATDPDPVLRLERTIAGYIGFSEAEPALFRLMFSKERVDRERHPAVRVAASAAFDRLKATIAALYPAEQVDDVSLAAWSLMHGYATLCNELGIEAGQDHKARAAVFAKLFAPDCG